MKNAEQTQAERQEKMSDLSYYLHQIERNNCLGETELAPGKTLKSCEVILKAVFFC